MLKIDPGALSRKNLALLIVFDVVAEMRSVTAAAERLSLTQSALSHALRRLRDLFDDQLFLRTPTGLALTPRAEALVTPIRELLYAAESLLQPEAFDPATFDREVRLGIGEWCPVLLDGPTLVQLREAAPRLRLSVDTLDGDGERKVQEGAFDVGLWYADHVPPSLHATELFSDRYVGVVHAEHPLAALNHPVSLGDYLDYPHLHVALPGMRRDPLRGALDQLEAERTIRISMPSYLAAFPPLAQSTLVGTVPSQLAAAAQRLGFQLATFDLPFETGPLPYRMFWSERTDKDPAGEWLRQTLAAAFAAARPQPDPAA
jgi:DNA-binding transcriptional LysR family regulator